MKLKPRRQYTAEFKQQAVQKSLESPDTVQAVAKQLDISPKTLGYWRRHMTQGKQPAVRNTGPDRSLKALEAENRRLKKQLEKAELKYAILKKANEYFDKHPK